MDKAFPEKVRESAFVTRRNNCSKNRCDEPETLYLSPQAENDLAEIYAYIAQDNSDAAERMLDKLLSACDLLTDNPRIGQHRYDLTPLPVRFWLVHPRYFLIYRGENPVEIVRVLAANMDIARELAADKST